MKCWHGIVLLIKMKIFFFWEWALNHQLCWTMILINYRLSQKFDLLENDEFNQLTIILTDMIAKLLLHYAESWLALLKSCLSCWLHWSITRKESNIYIPFNFDKHFLSLFSCMPTISTFNSTVCQKKKKAQS